MAEEFDATFGRTVLNQLIKDNLPDTEYSPSDLNEKLLRLEWKDIFTTNYDTLLERTQEKNICLWDNVWLKIKQNPVTTPEMALLQGFYGRGDRI